MKKDRDIRHLSVSLACFCFCFSLFLTAVMNTGSSAQSMGEYDLKAAFVLNFARFTQWPADSFEGADSPCNLCVVGNEELEAAFQAIDGKEVGTRKLRVSFSRGAHELQRCNLLFVSKDIDLPDVLKLFAAVKGRPVLTIGETEGFIRLGGMINFFSEEGRLRFEINPERSRQQKVKLSSRLLNLAVIVEDGQ